MRSLSRREIRLAVATGVVIAAAVSFATVRGRLVRLDALRQRRVSAELELLRQEGLLERRPELLETFQRVRAQLPRHPEGRDIKSDLSRQVQRLAAQSGLRLTALTPEPEEFQPDLDLYRTAIRCSWEGAPETLVGFLVRLHQLGAVADMRDLRIRARDRDGTTVSGTFTLEFAYSRTPEAAASASEPPDAGDEP